MKFSELAAAQLFPLRLGANMPLAVLAVLDLKRLFALGYPSNYGRIDLLWAILDSLWLDVSFCSMPRAYSC
jgi:hypothetical protein